MVPVIELFAVFLVGATVGCAIRLALRLRRSRLARMNDYREEFFGVAHELLARDCLDEFQLTRLKAMADDISEVRQLHLLGTTLVVLSGEMRSGNQNTVSNPASAEWGALLYRYFLALTYLRFVRGFLVRAMLARFLDPRVGTRNADVIDRRIHGSVLQAA